jgi:hypothetical protein
LLVDRPSYKYVPEPSTPPPPGRRKIFVDPSFQTTLVQLTDATDGAVNRISYGIWPAFSCDYSKILVQCDALFKVVTWNPATAGSWGDISLPASFQGSDATWSHTDPDSIYHRDGGSRLMVLNVATGVDAVVHDFAADLVDCYLTRMSSSANDDVFCFATQTTSYAFSGFVVYTRSTGTMYRQPPARNGTYFKVQIDKSGRYMWNVALDPQSEWWDLSLPNTQATVLTKGTGHAAVLTEKIVQYNNASNVDVAGPFGAKVTSSTIAWPDWDLATEYSGTDADESWYAATTGTTVPLGVLHDELLQVSTDGSGTVRRLCHLHNVLVDGDYNSIPQPATGYGRFSWVAFHSSWGSSGRRDVFLAKVSVAPVVGGVEVEGNYVSIYGAGFVGVPAVTVGGVAAVVTYAGVSGDGTEDQINVEVPAKLVGSGNQAVVVECGGVESNSTTVRV